MRYACLCCGHRTLAMRPGLSWELCEVCCYEDTPEAAGALRQAQEAFAVHGAVAPEYASLVRTPRPGEERPPWFATQAELPLRLQVLLHGAFGDQTLDGGVSLQEADLIDDYAMPSRTHLDPPPPGFGGSGPWHQVTDEEVEAYSWCPFSFLDARGLRFYLPVYIRRWAEDPDRDELGSLLFALDCGHQLRALRSVLTDAQCQVVARFLAAVVAAPNDDFDRDAARALGKGGWGQFLDPDQLAHIAVR